MYYPHSLQTADGWIYVFSHRPSPGGDDNYGGANQAIFMDKYRLVAQAAPGAGSEVIEPSSDDQLFVAKEPATADLAHTATVPIGKGQPSTKWYARPDTFEVRTERFDSGLPGRRQSTRYKATTTSERHSLSADVLDSAMAEFLDLRRREGHVLAEQPPISEGFHELAVDALFEQ